MLLLIIAGVTSLVAYNSSTQTLLVEKYLRSLSKDLNTKIEVQDVQVSFFKGVNLTNLYVEDLHHDTLLYINQLQLEIDYFTYKEKNVEVEKIYLKNPYFNLKKYQNENSSNLQFILDYFAPKDTLSDNQWNLELDKVFITRGRFNYDDLNLTKKQLGIDYNHISMTYIDAQLDDIQLIDKGVSCKIDQLKFFEQSGFQIDELLTEFQISPKGIVAQHLKLTTPNSKIDGNINFSTDSYKNLTNFINDVDIQSNFKQSLVGFRDIAYFAPTLNCLEKSLKLDGNIKGQISSLKAREVAILLDDGTSFKGDVDISGIPEVENLFLYVNVKELTTTKDKIEQIPLYPFLQEKFVELPSNFNQLGIIRFKGNFTGFTHDFVAYGNFKTSLGNVTTDVAVKVNNDKAYYKGKVKTDHFEMGEFFEIPDELGSVTMNIKVDGSGFSKEELQANLIGNIDEIVIRGYEYNNLEVKGDVQNQIFGGFLAVQDENIIFDFDGKVDLTGELPRFNFISNIQQAKLAKLNLIESKEQLKTRFSTRLKVDLIGDHIDNMVGSIEFLDAFYTDKVDSIFIGNVFISSSKTINSEKLFEVKSNVLNGKLEGDYQFKDLVSVSNNFITKYLPSFGDSIIRELISVNNFKFDIDFHNTDLLSKVLLKGIKLSDNTLISGYYNSIGNSLLIEGDIPQIKAANFDVNNSIVKINTDDDKLYLNLNTGGVYFTDSLYVNNITLTADVKKDTLTTALKWKNNDVKVKNEADLSATTIFEGITKNSTTINESYLYIADSLWKVRTNNLIQKDSLGFLVKNLSIAAKNQSILIDGKLSERSNDQLDVVLRDFNLLNFKPIISEKVIGLEGIVNGVASAKKVGESILFTSDLNFNQFKINNNLIGQGDLKSSWNTIDRFLNIDGKFYREHIPTILFSGNYYPYKKEETLDLNLELYQTELDLFDVYIKEHVSDIDGTANADLYLKGTFKEPSLTGTIDLFKPVFKINYLNTTYNAQTIKVKVQPDMITFDNAEIFDNYKNKKNGKATVNGTILHQWFKQFNFDLGINMNNFLALNTTAKDNKIYYGKAFVTGFADISYDVHEKQTNIDVDIQKTEKGSVFNIPLSNSEDVVENSFIEFVSNDSLGIKTTLEEKVDLSNLEMNFDLHVTEEAEVRLIFDDQIGDVMRSNGDGYLNININNQEELSIYGGYEIKDGDYLFTLQNVINKKFDIEEGGTIRWNGDPYEAQLDITAAYRTRTRLYDLFSGIDTSDVYKKRIPVDLKLQMRQAMLNPEIKFDIDLPTADEDTRSKVRSLLYVSDQQENIDELNRQVFSLLVLNRFLLPQSSDGDVETSGSAGVGAITSSELLSNQLSNWLSRISNDFDIGVNYTPGDDLSNQELELALSTQIFNDRLTIDSNFGLSDRSSVSSSTQNTNNLIGDVTLEYKISKDGKIRVKAFNISNQFSLEEINSPYTQGVGLFYKEEYDSLGEFIENFFSSFKRKTLK